MSLFSWLLMGHFVGDWLLQNDWMARGKRKGLFTKAGMVHFTIYTTVIEATLILAGATHQNLFWLLGIGGFIFITHWFVDATNAVDRWMELYQQTNITMVRVMVDQTFHLLVLMSLVLGLEINLL